MKITVIGTGYVGLVTGACFSSMGNEVFGIDVDESKIKKLQDGYCPIYEPGLSDLLEAHPVTFTTSFDSCKDADFVFLCVGTPPRDDGKADLSALLTAAASVGSQLNARQQTNIVIKSTVPVGTWKEVEEAIRAAAPSDSRWAIVSNPEFLKEGRAIDDFMRPDRVVVGTESVRARKRMRLLYDPILRNVGRLFECDNATAEISKYATNAMLATRISFMNEIALLCDVAGADVDRVRQILGSDRRVGPHFLFPGPGFGGSCFGKDVRALAASADVYGTPMQIPRATLAVNERQRKIVVNRIMAALPSEGGKVAVWGLTFKPGTDDTRDAPSVHVIPPLRREGIEVSAYDPQASFSADSGVFPAPNPYAACQGSDVLVLLTEWNVFKMPDWHRVRSAMRGRHVFDTRNLWSPEEICSYGLVYQGMGRGRV